MSFSSDHQSLGCLMLGSVEVGPTHVPGCPEQQWGSAPDFPVAPLKGCGLRRPFTPSPQLRAPPDIQLPSLLLLEAADKNTISLLNSPLTP